MSSYRSVFLSDKEPFYHILRLALFLLYSRWRLIETLNKTPLGHLKIDELSYVFREKRVATEQSQGDVLIDWDADKSVSILAYCVVHCYSCLVHYPSVGQKN